MHMGKMIEPTPMLRGKDAERFLALTQREEAVPNPERMKFIRECVLLYSANPF